MEIDIQTLELQNLKILDLTSNQITKIENLPKNLEELYLNNNQVNKISLKSSHTSLLHLGLAYNQLTDEVFIDVLSLFPNIFSLNVSFNSILNPCI